MKLRPLAAFLLLILGTHCHLSAADTVPPNPRLHAHNDYEHTRPLLDALDQGFCSVEADIYLVEGRLLVAHDRRKVDPARTLETVYLDPLRARAKANGGRIFADGPEVTLLIDLKQDWQQLYPALRRVLENYTDILSCYRDGVKQTNAVLVIITGLYDPKMFEGETVRYAALDGLVRDLETNPPTTLVPWVSANWRSLFRWRGIGAIPETELQLLRRLVTQAHEQGRKVRFWGAPDQPNFWQALHVAGVDLINTDNLPGAAEFFRSPPPPAKSK